MAPMYIETRSIRCSYFSRLQARNGTLFLLLLGPIFWSGLCDPFVSHFLGQILVYADIICLDGQISSLSALVELFHVPVNLTFRAFIIIILNWQTLHT